MQIIRTKLELRESINAFKSSGKTVGFVPTMGALHDGHLSLLDIARSKADIVVASIFVNPAQFAPHEDFDKYPRTQQSDLEKLQSCAVDIAYLPSVAEIYEENSSTKISVGEIGQKLEGSFRPHFFDGVALVVTKLFMQVAPSIAVFGEKDFQQLVVIKKLVRELDIPVEIIGAPILRENDGLAMSSRNIYLPVVERKIAANLYKILNEVKEKLLAGDEVRTALIWGKNQLLAAGFEEVDYIELCDINGLNSLDILKKPARLLATARLACVRLLDNIEI